MCGSSPIRNFTIKKNRATGQSDFSLLNSKTAPAAKPLRKYTSNKAVQ